MGHRGGEGRPFDSEKAKEEYARKAKDPNAKAMEAFKVGDADKALAGAAKTLEAPTGRSTPITPRWSR